MRITMSYPDGRTAEYVADLTERRSLRGAFRRADGTSDAPVAREGEHFIDHWRETIARLARASRGARCEPARGTPIRVDIDDLVQEVTLPAFPDDREYLPPEGDELRECAPRELARTMATILSWE